MAHIVVLGAGIGGMAAAYEFKDMLGKQHEITVINERDYFQFVPSNPWLCVGWRDRDAITFDIRKYLERKNINFIAKPCERIEPDENYLMLEGDERIDYDYLMIATGPRLAFEEVDGAGPDGGHTHSVCSVSHAELAYENYKEVLEDPGHIIIGAMPFASCFGPAYETAFVIDADLRKRKMRDKVPMTYVTSEPYIGHLGLAGVGDSKSVLESELRGHHINWICNAKVTKCEAGKMYIDECDEDGELKKQHVLEHKFSMMLPAFKGVDCVANVEGLCNPRGFVNIDEFQRSTSWKNIYSAGVCVAIPPIEATPVPTGAPKTGYMIESMVTAIVHNVANAIEGKEPETRATWNALCLADMGDTGAAFVALPQIPPRNVAWIKKGKWVHLAKIAYEKYFLSKMKSGNSEPIYEKYILKLLGIGKLKN